MCSALMAAVLYAAFAGMQKGIVNPWIMRGAIDISYGITALPIALIVVPWPEPHMWLIFAVTWGILFFREVFSWGQLAGVAALLSGIFGLALYNLQNLKLERQTLSAAQGFAPATDVFVAFYNTYDAYGMRALTDPFTFLASLFLIDSWSMLILGLFMRAIVISCSVARDCHGAGLWVALWPLPLLALY